MKAPKTAPHTERSTCVPHINKQAHIDDDITSHDAFVWITMTTLLKRGEVDLTQYDPFCLVINFT